MQFPKSDICLFHILTVLSSVACSESSIHISIATAVPDAASSIAILSRFERQDGKTLSITRDTRLFSVDPPQGQEGWLSITARPTNGKDCRYGSGSLQQRFAGLGSEEFDATLSITQYSVPICCTIDWCSVDELPTGLQLTGITGSDRSNLLTVGQTGIAFHFDGIRWASVPTESTLDLQAVWARRQNDIWAVFQTVTGTVVDGGVIHFNGTVWEKKELKGDPLLGIWGSPNGEVWAVGNNGAIWRFNGNSWRREPWRTNASLRSVHGSAPDDVWMVGALIDPKSMQKSGHIIHWDGAAPKEIANNATAYLRSVWAYSRNSAYVGGENGALLTWDGIKWSPMVPPTMQPGDIQFTSLWGSDPDSLWLTSFSEQGKWTRVDYWNGSTWAKQQESAEPIDCYWRSLWGLGRHEVWAVGAAATATVTTPAKPGVYVYLPSSISK